jgi:membrane protein YdbS with pleckstrin-like domain
MTGNSIESDEKPCPLTVGEWIALLTAESQVKSGYKNLAIMMLLMVFSITLTVYTATCFETFGPLTELIAIVGFCVIFALLIYYSKLTMNVFTEKDGNSEIIEEIVSGELTDSDEIRKRWKKHGTPANAEELLKICEKQIETRWKIVKFLKLTGYSFTGNFKAVKENIQFDTLNENEAEKFINACENRRERAKILLNEIAPLIGFDVVAMTVIASFAHEMVSISVYAGLLILLFICLIFLFIMLAHYRVHVHAWTAFGEEAILRKSPGGRES